MVSDGRMVEEPITDGKIKVLTDALPKVRKLNRNVLVGFAVFIDQCNFHGLISPVYYILEGSRVVCSGNPIYHITSSRKYLVFTV